MKCSLASIISALGKEFPLETCGDVDIFITDIQEISDTVLPSKPDVLYIARQSQLLHYNGPTARGPVLCISHSRWNLRGSQSTFPTLIMALCQESGRIYSVLSRFFYQEGLKSSELAEISSAFLRCRSLDALVETGYSHLGNPFTIHDSDGKLLSYSRQAGLWDAAWQNASFSDFLCSFHSAENAELMERSRRDQTPVLLHPESGPMQLRMALSSRGQTLGYLTVIALFRPFTHMDYQIAELLGYFISLDLLRQHSITRTSVSDAGRLKNFLESGENNTPDLPQWLEQQICPEGRHFDLLLINTASRTPFWDVDELLAQLDKFFPGSISTRLEAGVVLLYAGETPIIQQEQLDVLLEQLPTNLVAGISMPFQNLAESGHAALRQARQALALGAALDPAKNCYRYADYAIYAGFRAASGWIDLRELLPTELTELLDSDQNGEILHTLEVYLSTGGRKARASELLFIHLNTLKYRLNQISKKLNADLDDPATLFSLQYALHIIRYLRCFGTDPSQPLK